jgi:RNase P subunit RPR2
MSACECGCGKQPRPGNRFIHGHSGGRLAADASVCATCKAPAEASRGRARYCAKHFRFVAMRAFAKTRGKYQPTAAELEALIPPGMVCVTCQRVMNWLHTDGRSTQVTLQHDRSGAIRLICSACNTKHQAMPGDLIYALPASSKFCQKCETVLPLASFHFRKRGRSAGKPLSICISCERVLHRERKAFQHEIECNRHDAFNDTYRGP